MVRNYEGMTRTYNRFHDPYENDPGIAELRALHAAMDRAVLDAYDWTDIPTDCDFLLDYEIDEATWGRRKKPYRYRWPDPVRDEVLARLLALNTERAAEEARSGAASRTTPSKATPNPGLSQHQPDPLFRQPSRSQNPPPPRLPSTNEPILQHIGPAISAGALQPTGHELWSAGFNARALACRRV